MSNEYQATNCTSSIVYRTEGIPNDFIDNLVQTNLQPLMQSLADVDSFLESLRPEISRIAYGLLATGLHQKVEQADLEQEGLIGAWQCVQRFDAEKTTCEGAFKGYCIKRARGAMIDYIRSHYRTGGDALSVDDEMWLMVPAQAEPVTKVTPMSERRRINAALNKLTRLQRLAIKGEYGFCRDVVCHGGPYMTRQAVQRYFKNRDAFESARKRGVRRLATYLQPAAAAR